MVIRTVKISHYSIYFTDQNDFETQLQAAYDTEAVDPKREAAVAQPSDISWDQDQQTYTITRYFNTMQDHNLYYTDPDVSQSKTDLLSAGFLYTLQSISEV